MAKTLLQFNATAFEGDYNPVQASDLAAYFDSIFNRTVLVFIDGSDESAAITRAVEMPAAYASGTLTAHIGYFTGSTSGAVDWEIAVEAVTAGDAIDLDSANSFDSVNAATDTVPSTAGYLKVCSITLTNKDSVAVGDMVRFLVRRDADDAADTATSNAYLLWLAIEEA